MLALVLDNYATHKTPAIKEWLLKHPASSVSAETWRRFTAGLR
jgi:hypothetical protein